MAGLLPSGQAQTIPRAPHALAFSTPEDVARLASVFLAADGGLADGCEKP